MENNGFYSPYGNHAYNPMGNSVYNFIIKEFKVYPTRPTGYRDMVVRGFTSFVDNNTRENIIKTVEQRGQVPTNLAGIVSLGTAPISVAKISGGWMDQRVGFRMIVNCVPKPTNTTLPEYDLVITGYSDPTSSFIQTDYTGKMHPDMDLRFFINGIEKISISRKLNSITGMHHLGITNPYNFTMTESNVAMRPEDIMSDINSRTIASEYNGGVIGCGITANNDPIAVNKLQLIGGTYASDIVNSVVQGATSSSTSRMALQNLYASGMSQNLTEATHFLHNDTVDTDLFLQALKNVSPFNIEDGYVFSINSLSRLDNTFGTHKVDYINIVDAPRTQGEAMLMTADTEWLSGGSVEQAKVAELHNAIIALFTQNFLYHLEIQLFNAPVDTPMGRRLECQWRSLDKPGAVAAGYNGMVVDPRVSQRINTAINYYLTKIVDPKLSDNGNTQYDAIISADLAGDTTIAISFDGRPHTIYRFATFADMAFSPMVADMHTKDSMVTNMSAIATDVASIVSSNLTSLNYNYGGNYGNS